MGRWIFLENSDLLETFARGISDSSLFSRGVEYSETNISPPRLPMVLVKNDWSGMSLCMPGECEWCSVDTERRLRTSREIITAVISWLKDPPMALRSGDVSCKGYQWIISACGEGNDWRSISRYSLGSRGKSPKSRGSHHGRRCIWLGTSQNLWYTAASATALKWRCRSPLLMGRPRERL